MRLEARAIGERVGLPGAATAHIFSNERGEFVVREFRNLADGTTGLDGPAQQDQAFDVGIAVEPLAATGTSRLDDPVPTLPGP